MLKDSIFHIEKVLLIHAGIGSHRGNLSFNCQRVSGNIPDDACGCDVFRPRKCAPRPGTRMHSGQRIHAFYAFRQIRRISVDIGIIGGGIVLRMALRKLFAKLVEDCRIQGSQSRDRKALSVSNGPRSTGASALSLCRGPNPQNSSTSLLIRGCRIALAHG